MRKLLLAIVTVLVVFHPIVYLAVQRIFFSSPWVSASCDKEELSSVDSPDLQWQAKAIQFLCGDGFASDDWVSIVVVKHGHRPSKDDELLEVSSRWNDGARLDWQNGNSLQIFVPEGMAVYSHGPAAMQVTSEIKVGRYGPP